jgi:hypothetical protein
MHSRCDKQNEMSMHMMSCSSFSASNTRGVTERKCEAQKGARIRSNLKSNMVSWTVRDEKHSINSLINLEI